MRGSGGVSVGWCTCRMNLPSVLRVSLQGRCQTGSEKRWTTDTRASGSTSGTTEPPAGNTWWQGSMGWPTVKYKQHSTAQHSTTQHKHTKGLFGSSCWARGASEDFLNSQRTDETGGDAHVKLAVPRYHWRHDEHHHLHCRGGEDGGRSQRLHFRPG